MKKNVLLSVRLTLTLILLCAVIYPLLVAGIAWFTPGKGGGVTVTVHGKVAGYERVGQQFSSDYYFQGRPSAVAYNSATSGGSNKGPSNPGYLELVQGRIDSFLVHNPGISKSDIPAELVTASGSGLDPHISPAGAYIQVKRIAALRHLPIEKINALVQTHVETPWPGPDIINVLKLNIALDELK